MIQRVKEIYKGWQSDKNLRYLSRGGGGTALTLLLTRGLGLISGWVIARFYGASVLGVIATVNLIITIVSIFANMGIKEAMLRFIPEYREKYNFRSSLQVYKKGLQLLLSVAAIGIVVVMILMPIQAKKWNEEHLLPLYLISCLFILPNLLMEMNNFSLRAIFKIKQANYSLSIRVVFRVTTLIIITVFFYTKLAPVYIHLATILVGAIIPFFFLYKHFFSKVDKLEKVTPINNKTLITVSFPMLLTYSSFAINNFADIYMIKHFGLGNAQVGIYRQCFKLAQLASIIMVALNTTVQPKLSQLFHNNNHNELKRIARKSSKMMVLFSIPLFLLLTFGAKYVLMIYGKEFVVGTWVLIIMTIGQIVNTVCGPVAQLMNVTGHQNALKNIVISAAIINVVMNLFLIPIYGIIGAAVASMASMVIWNIFGSIYIKRKFGFFVWYVPLISKK